jgi:hypothetical protein
MVYIGLPSNAQFLRDPAERDPASVAEVISRSRGLSGENRDYLYQLEEALEGLGLGSADPHVTDLVRRVKQLEATTMTTEEERRGRRPCASDDGVEKLEAVTRQRTSSPEEFEDAARISRCSTSPTT